MAAAMIALQAGAAVGQSPERRSVEELARLFWREGEYGVDRAVMLAVFRAVQRLDDPKESIRKAAEQQLLDMGTSAVIPLCKLKEYKGVRELLPRFGPTAVPELVRFGDSETLLAMGPSAIPAIVKAWGEHPERSLAPHVALQGMGKDATPYLIPLMSHESSKIRFIAADIIATTLDPTAWDAMMTALRASPDPVIRKRAALYMFRLRDPRAAPDFLELVQNPFRGLREAGISGLASVYEDRYLGPILGRAKWDGDAAVRDTACNAMENVGLPLLKRLAKRYRPQSYDPAAAAAVQLAQLMLFGTSVAFSTLIIGLRKWAVSRLGPGHVAAWLGLLAALSWGVFWGFWVRRVGGVDELAFLLIAIPFAMLVARVFNPSAPEGNKSAAKASSRWSALAMYGGYAIGQTALWGGSLAWLWLGWPISTW